MAYFQTKYLFNLKTKTFHKLTLSSTTVTLFIEVHHTEHTSLHRSKLNKNKSKLYFMFKIVRNPSPQTERFFNKVHKVINISQMSLVQHKS